MTNSVRHVASDTKRARYWREESTFSHCFGTHRDRNVARATLGKSLAVSAFPLYVPIYVVRCMPQRKSILC